ncbi:MAG: hypothetical protein C4520_15520 [Candidatus Abyssobacteria bacterium SURF_5]|uniref:Alginate export domain-containing protein n=1 Tax=Abyssobacteria bacterium (strain SURF_5) TaxID=2093360 RepID=A0A3A4N878_ABYX5|nr:MAG: hypothetical protein C4520_15520 [Candidatus Abyssubacteria bacterium SURF_5]
MRKWVSLFFLSLILIFPSAAESLEPEYREFHILKTEEATTVGQGNLRTEIEFGVTKQPDASELYSIPRLRLTYGLSDWADLEFEYDFFVVRDTTFVKFPTGEIVSDHDDESTGDLRVKVKMSPYEFGRNRLGFEATTKFPMADRDEGVGTNETDFVWQFLLTSDWGRLLTHLNAGMAIIGDPAENRNQRDFLILGAGAEYGLTDSLTLMAEINGSTWSENGEKGFTDNIAEASHGSWRAMGSIGLTGPIGNDWRWGLLARKGLNNHTDDWGVQGGLSRVWGIGGSEEPAAAEEERRPDPETFFNPMKTATAYTIGERNFHLELAADYINQPDDSDLYVLPDLTVGWGIGPWADFQVQLQYLMVRNSKRFDSSGAVIEEDIDETGQGDAWAKFKFSPFDLRCGRLGAELITKVPSADDKDALGTDEADIVFRGLLSTDWSEFYPDSLLGRLKTHLNAGIAIQGNPYKHSSQNDLFIWGVLAEYELLESLTLWAELEGSNGGPTIGNVTEGVYGDDFIEARLGLTGPFPLIDFLDDWKWGVTASAGMTSESRDWTASVGVSHTWGL